MPNGGDRAPKLRGQDACYQVRSVTAAHPERAPSAAKYALSQPDTRSDLPSGERAIHHGWTPGVRRSTAEHDPPRERTRTGSEPSRKSEEALEDSRIRNEIEERKRARERRKERREILLLRERHGCPPGGRLNLARCRNPGVPPRADRLQRGSYTPSPPRCQPASALEGRRRVRCLDMRLARTANALQPLPGASPDGSPARAFQVSP